MTTLYSNICFSEQNTWETNVKVDIGKEKNVFVGIDEYPQQYQNNSKYIKSDYKIYISKEVHEISKINYFYDQIAKDFDLFVSTQKRMFMHKSFSHIAQEKKQNIPVFINWCDPLLPNMEKEKYLLKKENKISFMPGKKNFLVGHKLRHYIYNKITNKRNINNDNFVLYPSSTWVEDKKSIFQNNQYSIRIENIHTPGYMSEKIVDCLLRGSIPIYWGANDIIQKYFDTKTILFFESEDQFENIVNNIATDVFYKNNIRSIINNMSICEKNIDRGKDKINPLYYFFINNILKKAFKNGVL